MVPRLIAGVVTLPILVLVADIIGVLGGFLVGVYKLGFNDAAYLRNTLDFLQFQDVFSGLVKAAVFGFLIALMGCYHGYTSQGRRPGRRHGDDQRGGLGLDPDPDLQLLHHRSLLRALMAALAQDRAARRHQGLRAQAGAARHRPRRRGRANRWW